MNSDRDTPVTDHEFELSPYCDCQACSELCHYRYGFEDACIRERHEHITPTVPGKYRKGKHEGETYFDAKMSTLQ